MNISGIHSFDVGMVSVWIPQKSEEFQVRNSFCQPWKNTVLIHSVAQETEAKAT